MEKIKLFNLIPINFVSKKFFINLVTSWLNKKSKKRIYYMNVHGIITFFKNKKTLRVLDKADIIYPDGWGPILAVKILHNTFTERVNAADFIDKFLTKLNLKRVRIYLLGGEKNIIQLATDRLRNKYKNIVLTGYHHGFFDKLEGKKIIREINIKKPQLVLIGMGSPEQELWVNDNWETLPNSVFWTVGGLFYYIAGIKSRAPIWMRKYSLEWLYRLLQEPGRLTVRYTWENLIFAYLVLSNLLKKYFRIKRF
ncbi:hypothetical protein A2774_02650 [Candidatus Roizmanbacteria bacterium RIFCSPHIGHO2_01_FULL_39_12c]|uniref:Glycosyl transferase n=1 Tax=Candidatus Roizmanbacteria bacterium RIFCSPHIGHO2_01_FULL_39_12c TaxID=1802031 RepID=A0A1F7GAI7_9BACT|nr:MAG: hypothetical protein A2774_02650 [Candidatus Roizmanbacteria bacterium RIFCSPHIGHO2_01_FULL_39_12c]